MKVTYFINQYPMVSHSFIRREIMALERIGVEVQRISLRGWDVDSVNEDDRNEKKITQYVLSNGLISILQSLLKVLFHSPFLLISTLFLSIKLNRNSGRSFFHSIISLAEACHILPILKSFGSQHIHAHFGTNSTEVVMLANALGGPSYSFTVHGPEEFDKPLSLHLREKITNSKFVVAISSFGRSQLYRWIDKSQWNKIKVVHCGLEKAFHNVATKALPEVPRLVCVGRLCEQKGQLLLVEACHILDKRGIDFELVLAGDGDMRHDVEQLINQYQLQSKIKITGWISSEQVREEILLSKGLVLPSFAEGLPVVIMEAMSLRRPVLSTFVAGIPELINSGNNGLLFVAGDVNAIADSISNFLSMPQDTIAKMAEEAYASVTKRHDIDTEAEKLKQHFQAAIEAKLS